MPSSTDISPAGPQRMDRQEFLQLVGISIGAITFSQCVSGCAQASPEPDGSAKTGVTFPFTVNLNDTKNDNLKLKGGYVIVNEVIIARTIADEFVAVGAYCTHAGSQLVFRSAESRFYCASHGSMFTQSGQVLNGPAVTSLTIFKVTADLTKGQLTISA